MPAAAPGNMALVRHRCRTVLRRPELLRSYAAKCAIFNKLLTKNDADCNVTLTLLWAPIMDFAKNNFAGDESSPNANSGSAAQSENSNGSAEPAAESAGPDAKADAHADAPQAPKIGPATGPMSGEVLGPSFDGTGRGDKAGAKARQGSALILIPPVTRGGAGPDFSAKAETSADFKAERISRFGPSAFFKDGWTENWGRYAVPAALGFFLFGIGIATGGQFFGGAATPAAKVASADSAQTKATQIELSRLNKKLGDEIHALRARVDSLRSAMRAQSPETLRGLKADVDSLKASVEKTKAETEASIAQVTARLDHLQHEEARSVKPMEKLSRNEKLGPPAATAAIARPIPQHGTPVALATPLPKGQAKPIGLAVEPKKKLRLLTDWVVRDVYEGVALIEGPYGALEVTRGETIPGAGMVEAIEHRGNGWVVITNRGMLAETRRN